MGLEPFDVIYGKAEAPKIGKILGQTIEKYLSLHSGDVNRLQ
jgi:hypothetical protein